MDAKVLKDTGRYIIIKAILLRFFVMFKVVYGNGVEFRVYHPIFPYPRRAVLEKFYPTVQPFRTGGGNFNDPVRRAVTAPLIQFAFIAYHRNVRFDIV